MKARTPAYLSNVTLFAWCLPPLLFLSYVVRVGWERMWA